MKPFKKTYYSNGKLLLTGEYLVLDSAKALAVPTKFGQDLTYLADNKTGIAWSSFDEKKNRWFETKFELPILLTKEDDQIVKTLKAILLEAQKRNPIFLTDHPGFRVTTKLDFPKDWGLGSSSTLINNIAQWAKVDAFKLLQKTMGGSGYDIACAQNDKPIFYKMENEKSIVKPVGFYPKFKEQLYFVYLNKKQRSHKEIIRYRSLKKDISTAIYTVSEITDLITKTTDVKDFEMLINEHEKLLSNILQIPPIQEIQFKDYFGQTKSLGAWGGDFILATGNDDTPNYFKKKGFETILLYDEMVL